MNNSNNSELQPLTRIQILVIMGLTALTLLIIAKLWQKLGSIDLLNWQLTIEALFWGLATCGIIIITSSLIYYLWPGYRRSADHYLELVLKPLVWSDLIWLGLLPGLSEELLFRGVILPAFGFNLGALILSSCIFGILHLSGAEQWPYAVWATFVGFLLGYTAILTNNLAVPIIAHIITNFLSGFLWKFKQSFSSSS